MGLGVGLGLGFRLTNGHSTEGVIQRTLQLGGRTRAGSGKAVRRIRHRDRLATFKARFHRATQVPASGHFAVLAAAGDPDRGKSDEERGKDGLDSCELWRQWG
jgi:hypothetical protein